MYKTLSAPHIAQIEVTSLCPNRCQHCYNFWRKSGGFEASASLTLTQADRIVDEIIAHHVFHIVITGGEPLANKATTFHILERAADGGVTTSINSSLISLTKSDVDLIRDLGVKMVMTSILGPNSETHGEIAQNKSAFDLTVKGIRLLQSANVPVSVNMVVSKKNHGLIRETGDLVKSLGVNIFNATRAGCPGNCLDFSDFSLNIEEFRSYLETLHILGKEENMSVDVLSAYPLCGIKDVNRYTGFMGRRCMAGVNTLTISASGEVRPCNHIDTSYGNILQESMSEIWRRMIEWRDGSLMPNICRSCKILPWCGGGCRMEAKMRSGSISNIDPYACPSDSEFVYDQLINRHKTKVALPEIVRLNPKIRRREESFGATIFVDTHFGCYLNPDGFKWLKMLPYGTDLFSANLVERFGRVKDGFIEGLFDRRVLLPSSPNN